MMSKRWLAGLLLVVLGCLLPAFSQVWMKGGHRGGTRVIFSTDRRFLISCANDNTIKVWNADLSSPRFGQLVASTRAHVAVVEAIAEKDGLLVSGGGFADNLVKLWRIQTDGKLRLVNSWSVGSYGVKSVAFVNWLVNGSPKRVIVAGSYNTVWIIDFDTGRLLSYRFPWMPGEEPRGWVVSIAVSPSNNEFAVGTDRGYIYVLRPSSLIDPVSRINLPNIIHLFRYGDNELNRQLYSVQYDTTGDFLFAGGRAERIDAWNLYTGARVFSVPFENSAGGRGWVLSIQAYRWSGTFALRQYLVASGWTSYNNAARPTVITYTWDTVSSVPPTRCGEHIFTSMQGTAFAGALGSSLYAVGTEAGRIAWWQLRGPCLDDWTLLNSPTIYEDPVKYITFSHDDAFVASGSDGPSSLFSGFHVWDINGNLVFSNSDLSADLFGLRFSPVAPYRLVEARGNVVRCFTYTGSTFALAWSVVLSNANFPLYGGIAFSPNGTRLLAAGWGPWWVLNTENGAILLSRVEAAGGEVIRCISSAWSPNSSYPFIAIGRADGKIRLYHYDGGSDTATLAAELRVGSYMNPTALAFSVEGGTLKLYVGTSTGKLQRWRMVSASNWLKESEDTIFSERITSINIRDNWMVVTSTEVPGSIKVWINGALYTTINTETGTGVWDAAFASRVYQCGADFCRNLAYARQDATAVLTTVRYIMGALKAPGGRQLEIEIENGGERK